MARFIRIPFGLSGDRTAVPDAVQPGGEVSFSQGFGPDYEIAPGDPGWKPVPRDESNGLYFDIFDNIRQYQLYGVPEWVDASQNGGVAVSYPLAARVRHNDIVYGSVVANNTVEPGTDPTKWVVDEPFSLSVSEASLAEALAGTLGTKVITPRRLASSVQQGSWTYAAAGGSANAWTAALAPAAASLAVGMTIRLLLSQGNTGAVTLNVNGLGAVPVTRIDGAPFGNGDLTAGIIGLVYTGTSWLMVTPPAPASAADMLAGTSVVKYVTPSLIKDGFRFFDALLTSGTNVPNNTMVTPAIDAPLSNSLQDSTIGPGSKITAGPNDAGVWHISGFSQYTGAGPNKSVRIHKNGSPGYLASSRLDASQNGSGEANDTYTVTATTRVAAGDVISMDLLHSMGVTGQVSQGRFSITRLGA